MRIFCLLVSLAAIAGAQDDIQPNIILFLADDMGMGDTSAYQDITGNSDDKQIHTPNLEKLAERGVRFTDAHTPASRCTTTRYALMTGRYAWRGRLKHWVLFGSQGDPLIEPDRPTIPSMLSGAGYHTHMVGKWHVGLRYRQSDGSPAAGWADADLTQPLHTTPVDQGFDFALFTSRSHGTSGATANGKNQKRNGPNQNVGPGHILQRKAIAATGNGKQLVDADDPKAYILEELGPKHFEHGPGKLDTMLKADEDWNKPFFLYYASPSNHGPYTPADEIRGVPVKGAARTKSGEPMGVRYDFIYENDVFMGLMLDWLKNTQDPRYPDKTLEKTTLVIFTSDNGSEIVQKTATGPYRSNKGSCYEGGHRVAFIASWPGGGVSGGKDVSATIGLQDLYATFADLAGVQLPDLEAGEKGAEDSVSIVPQLRGANEAEPRPQFYHDHKEAKDDPAVAAMRFGKWKIFFDASLIRSGEAEPYELYDLEADPKETTNRIDEPELEGLVSKLTEIALLHRTSGGHRAMEFAPKRREIFNAPKGVVKRGDLQLTIQEDGKALEISFNQNVIVESVGLSAGENGSCGGFYKLGDNEAMQIYCIDGDNDQKDQGGAISDLGILKNGQTLRLDPSPFLGVEAAGEWALHSVAVRPLGK
ncbi:MAG: arylsulfatase [Verrucomicrobiota bacterium]